MRSQHDRQPVGVRSWARKGGRITAAAAVAALALMPGRAARAGDGGWNSDQNGNWEDAAQWLGGTSANIADGAGSTAIFAVITDLTTPRNIGRSPTVTLTINRTIGNLTFQDSDNNQDWTLARSNPAAPAVPPVLTLNDGAGNIPTINANRPGTANTRTVTISAVLAGANGFEKIGVNTLNLSGANTGLSGDAFVRQGTVLLDNASALGTTVVSIDPGGTTGAALQTDSGITVANAITVGATGTGTVSIGGNSGNASAFTGAITLNRTTSLTGSNNGTVTFSGPISGAGGITKTGNGAVIITGATSQAGPLQVNAGTLRIDSALATVTGTSIGLGAAGGTSTANPTLFINDAAGAPNPNRLADVPIVQQNAVGARIRYDGQAAAASAETLGNLTIQSAGSINTIDVRPGAGQSAALTFGTLTRNGTAALRLTSPAGFVTSGPGARVQFTGGVGNDGSGILGPWASVNGDFASVSDTDAGVIVAYTGYAPLPADLGTTAATPANYQQTGTPGTPLSGSGTVNTLKLDAGTAGQTIDLGGSVITVAAGGLLKAGSGRTTVTGTTGSITMAAGPAYVHVDAGVLAFDPGRLVLAGTGPQLVKTGGGTLSFQNLAGTAPSAFGQAVRIEGTLDLELDANTAIPAAGVITGPGGLTVRGPGTLSFGADNSYAGPTVIDGGGVSVASFAGRFGDNPNTVTLQNGGRLLLTASSDPGGNTKALVIGAGGGTVDVAPTFTFTLNDGGQLSSPTAAAGNTLTKTGDGVLILGSSGTGYGGFDGDAVLNGGVLRLFNGSSLGDTTDRANLRLTSGSLQLRNNTNNTAYPANITVNGAATIDVNRENGSGGVTLASSGAFAVNAGSTLNLVNTTGATNSTNFALTSTTPITVPANVTINQNFTGGIARFDSPVNLGANTLTIGGTGTGTVQFGNAGNATQGVISGTGGLVVGTTNNVLVSLFAPNTYSGGTTINAGRVVPGISSAGAPGAPTSGPLGTGPVTINGGQLRSTANGPTTVLNAVTVGGNFTLGEFGTGTVDNPLTLAGPVTLTGDRTITTAGFRNAARIPSVISGPIDDGPGSFRLTVAGTSVLTLTGANTHKGGTDVTGGTLLANNAAGSATGTGPVTVSGPGALAGIGSIAGPLTVNPGGTVAPGPLLTQPGGPVGTLTVAGGVTLAPGAAAPDATAPTLSVKLRADGTSDRLAAGGLTLTNTDRLLLNALDPIGSTPVTYTIVTTPAAAAGGPAEAYAGVFDGVFFNTLDANGIPQAVPAQSASPSEPFYAVVDYSDPNVIRVNVANASAVPEPGTIGLLAAAATGLLARRRRR